MTDMGDAAMSGIDIGVLLLRVAVGATFLAHGWNHLFGGGKLAGTARWFSSLGMRPGKLQAILASATELGAGLLLILGFLTPIAAGALAATMVVAFMIEHRTRGFFIFRPGQGWEYVMNLFVACLAIGAIGAQRWSLDDALGMSYGGSLNGLWITLALGLGSAALLLLAAWRPAKPDGV